MPRMSLCSPAAALHRTIILPGREDMTMTLNLRVPPICPDCGEDISGICVTLVRSYDYSLA